MCEACGPDYQGSVFELSPSNSGWVATTLHNFCSSNECADGEEPVGNVIIDEKGNLYGTTARGGTGFQNLGGLAYELSQSAGVWTEQVLYNFCSSPNCTDGEAPVAGVTFGGNGNLYGT